MTDTDTGHTRKERGMQKAQQEQPQQQQQQWDNKIQNHIWGTCVVQVGKIFKKLFLGGSHVLEFGFGVEFRFVFFFILFCCWVCCQLLVLYVAWDSDSVRHSQKSKFKRFQSVAVGMQLKRKIVKKLKKKTNEA